MPEARFTEFSLPATGGSSFNPADHRGHPLVIFFYPKDNTPGCTAEAQQFRDLHADFQRLGCAVVGISRDSLKSHEGFKTRFNLPFELASDSNETACAIFSVIKLKKLYGKEVRGIERSTFVLDAAGTIAREWRGVKVPGHAQEVLDFVRTLASS